MENKKMFDPVNLNSETATDWSKMLGLTPNDATATKVAAVHREMEVLNQMAVESNEDDGFGVFKTPDIVHPLDNHVIVPKAKEKKPQPKAADDETISPELGECWNEKRIDKVAEIISLRNGHTALPTEASKIDPKIREAAAKEGAAIKKSQASYEEYVKAGQVETRPLDVTGQAGDYIQATRSFLNKSRSTQRHSHTTLWATRLTGITLMDKEEETSLLTRISNIFSSKPSMKDTQNSATVLDAK
jgi:hypothetical protein